MFVLRFVSILFLRAVMSVFRKSVQCSCIILHLLEFAAVIFLFSVSLYQSARKVMMSASLFYTKPMHNRSIGFVFVFLFFCQMRLCSANYWMKQRNAVAMWSPHTKPSIINSLANRIDNMQKVNSCLAYYVSAARFLIEKLIIISFYRINWMCDSLHSLSVCAFTMRNPLHSCRRKKN